MNLYKESMLPLRQFIALLFGLLLSLKVSAQFDPNRVYKNKDYENAVRWLQNNSWVYDSLSVYGVAPDKAIAIVFPELMRYSALEDKMEVTGLMVLYTRLGKGYADFSVGRFQMKPSFVRHLETDAGTYLPAKEIARICPFLLDGKDTQANRGKRVKSLTNVAKEVRYLALFYLICQKKFGRLRFGNETDKIRFLATAYNGGYYHSTKYLFQQIERQNFPVYEGLSAGHVNYASLSLVWWKQNANDLASRN